MTYKNMMISVMTMMVVLLAAWTTLSYRPKTFIPIEKVPEPDAFMENVVATIFSKQGKPKMKIVTSKLVHYTENDMTHLSEPVLTLYRQSPQPWRITANHAKAIQGVDKVDFWGNVIIRHAADFNGPTTLIRTPSLTVFPNKQVAETREPITLAQPHTLIKAVGMYADIITGNIQLLSQTRGEYVPSS